MTWLQVVNALLWPVFLAVIGALFRVVWSRISAANKAANAACVDLATYKLEVSEKYASTRYLGDVDRRLENRLEKIESKLDRISEWLIDHKGTGE